MNNRTHLKNKPSNLRRILSFVLIFALVFSCTPTQNVYAASKKKQKPTIKAKAFSINESTTEKKKPISIKKAHGKVTYTLVSHKNFFSINKKTGALTIKKTTKPGLYKVKVKVSVKGNSKYKSFKKTVTVKITVNAKDVGSVWTGKADTSWFTGDKTSYDITTADQLAGLAKIVNTVGDEYRLEGITINLKCDVVLNDTSNWNSWSHEKPAKRSWTPIGQIGSPVLGYRPFAGVFNGNGHTIRGLFIDGGENCGLFNYVSGAIIKDLNIDKCVISTNEENGQAAAGAITGISEYSYFQNCTVKNVKIDGSAEIGGMIGKACRQNYLIEITNAFLLGMGIIINPLVFKAVEGDMPQKIAITYVSKCSVENATLRSYKTWGSGDVGGIIGNISTTTGILNSKTKNINTLSIDLIDYSKSIVKFIDVNNVSAAEKNGSVVHKGNCGAVYGGIADQVNVVVNECSYSSFKRLDNSKRRSDSSKVK